jgi:hypothetical protein
MLAHKLRVTVPGSRRLEITLPDDMPEGEAEVVVLFPQQSIVGAVKPGSREAVLSGLGAVETWRAANHDKLRTKEQIDAHLAEERDAWNDD